MFFARKSCFRIILFSISLLAILPATAVAQTPSAPTVLLISVDGLKPEAVLQAQAHGLKVPNLAQLSRDGVYSTGVHGVLPTVTYPSHTTLLTGASPARHGIVANTTFDPLNKNAQGWYWYAEDIKVPTLWDVAHKSGLTTASVYWPVSVGAAVDFNLPQIWRTGTPDDLKLQKALSTPGLEQELSSALGRYPGGMEETVNADEVRANFAIRILETKHPALMTVYLTGLDTEQHKSGPFSASSNAVLERLDAVVGKLRAAAEKVSPGRSYVCVVSDHGFAPVQHDVNLYAAFREAGLFSMDASRNITSWKAMPWPAGGAAGIMLADAKDSQTNQKVAEMLQRLGADPANGIDRVLTHDELQQRGGFPDAAFFVSFKIGYELGYGFDGALIAAPANGGMHGYLPENQEMRSSFFLVGPNIPQGHSLGEIDMRSIAPTLADLLHLQLPAAELPSLDVRAASAKLQ
jgi:predicted AlkP superfamily pyrophosphatase or phosphodiesterase